MSVRLKISLYRLILISCTLAYILWQFFLSRKLQEVTPRRYKVIFWPTRHGCHKWSFVLLMMCPSISPCTCINSRNLLISNCMLSGLVDHLKFARHFDPLHGRLWSLFTHAFRPSFDPSVCLSISQFVNPSVPT